MDPYLVGMIYGDGSVSKRKDGAYAVWVDQAEKNRPASEASTNNATDGRGFMPPAAYRAGS